MLSQDSLSHLGALTAGTEATDSRSRAPSEPASVLPQDDPNPYRYKNVLETEARQKNPKYQAFTQWGRELGANLDKVEYPAAFGRRGELLGFAVNCDI